MGDKKIITRSQTKDDDELKALIEANQTLNPFLNKKQLIRSPFKSNTRDQSESSTSTYNPEISFPQNQSSDSPQALSDLEKTLNNTIIESSLTSSQGLERNKNNFVIYIVIISSLE